MKNIIGRFEKVDFPEFGVLSVEAKIDTGAYSGAMFATNIHVESDLVPRLYFSPFDRPGEQASTTKFHQHWVRSSHGDTKERYFIETQISLGGKTYPASISLANRSAMRYPVLLGRKFLRKHGFLVDVSQDNR